MGWEATSDSSWGTLSGSKQQNTSASRNSASSSSGWGAPPRSPPDHHAPVPALPPPSPTTVSRMAGGGRNGGGGGWGGGGGGYSRGGGEVRDAPPHQQQQDAGWGKGGGGGGHGQSGWGAGEVGAARQQRANSYEHQIGAGVGRGGGESSWSHSSRGGRGGGEGDRWGNPARDWAPGQRQSQPYQQRQQQSAPTGYGAPALQDRTDGPRGSYGSASSRYGNGGPPPRPESNSELGGWGGQGGGDRAGNGGMGQSAGGGWASGGGSGDVGGYGSTEGPRRNFGMAPHEHGGAYRGAPRRDNDGGGGYGRPPARRDGNGGGAFGGAGGHGVGGGSFRGGGRREFGDPPKPSSRPQYSEPVNLQAVDFSQKELPKFAKDFYVPHANIAARTDAEVDAFRLAKNITVEGDAPRPIHSWAEGGLPDYLAAYIERQRFPEPTAVQSQGMPMALSGQDLIAISETGSGKTLAYALPAVLHVNAQDPTTPESGPIALVLSPTRELATQIFKVFKDIGKSSHLTAACAYGGVPKLSQLADIKQGCDVLVATPGRLLDFVSRGDVVLDRVTYLVLDEADRMLYMGFGAVVRPDRQVLMFSATWPQEVRQLAREYLKNAVRVTIGADETHAASKIKQEVILTRGYGDKLQKLADLIEEVKAASGKILIFANTKRGAMELTDRLRDEMRYEALSLHGDKEQGERDFALNEFRAGTHPILVATDVAQRGLDVPGVSVVLNFDCPQEITAYVHRIGRTGRAGHAGRAITFLDRKRDSEAMGDAMIKVFGEADQEVPRELMEFARGSFSSGAATATTATTATNWGSSAATTSTAPAQSGWGGSAATDGQAKSKTVSPGWGSKAVEADRRSFGSSDTAHPVDEEATSSNTVAASTPRPPSPASHPLQPASSPPTSLAVSVSAEEKAYDSGYSPSSPEGNPFSPVPSFPTTSLKPLQPVMEVPTPVDEREDSVSPKSPPTIEPSATTSAARSTALPDDEAKWLDDLLNESGPSKDSSGTVVEKSVMASSDAEQDGKKPLEGGRDAVAEA
ncbi:hypothetical protein JCM11251_004079 [Rhodosporidiobolus azoricus]